MPRENKKRGHRAEAQKRKRAEVEDDEHDDLEVQKRPRTAEGGEVDRFGGVGSAAHQNEDYQEFQETYDTNEYEQDAAPASDRPFYGLLDEDEQRLFKEAENDLKEDQFNDEEERDLFLRGIYEQAEGKELKIACSQACSRLLERLILLSTREQLKSLFQKFSGHFLSLVQHRFASHCCEMLFIKSAPSVTEERLQPDQVSDNADSEQEGHVFVSMENLFLYAINELEGNLGYLLTDRFASHTLRVLLSVLSGRALDAVSSRSVLKSKRKENIQHIGAKRVTELQSEARTVPSSFMSALEKMIRAAVEGLDTTYLRALATHQTGNPTLQLLLRLEMENFGKQRAKNEDSLLRKLLPDDQIVEGTESASFINGLLYDPIGSRLLETIVECAPGKSFKALYQQVFKDRMASLARNEIAGYVASKVLERLSSHDLSDAMGVIITQLPNLVERGRTSVIKTLVDRCAARGLDSKPLANALKSVFQDPTSNKLSLVKFLGLPDEFSVTDDSTAAEMDSLFHSADPLLSTPNDRGRGNALSTSVATSHASLLAQSMLMVEGPLSDLIFESISQLEPRQCLKFALSSNLSPILQKSLTRSYSPLIFRRKLITRFYSYMSRLSQHPSGSHLVDAIWSGTQGLAFARERVAEELAEDGEKLHQDRFGRLVWRNWRMDLYSRNRSNWVRQVRNEAGNEAFLSFPDDLSSAIPAAEDRSPANATTYNSTASPAMRATSAGSKAMSGHQENMFNHPRRNSKSSNPVNGHKAKSKIELARERFMRTQQQRNGQQNDIGSMPSSAGASSNTPPSARAVSTES